MSFRAIWSIVIAQVTEESRLHSETLSRGGRGNGKGASLYTSFLPNVHVRQVRIGHENIYTQFVGHCGF